MNPAKSKALINYGASVNWPFERFKAMDKYKTAVNDLYLAIQKGESKLEKLLNTISPGQAETLSPEEMNKMVANIKASLAEGGIGIGAPIGYIPKSKPGEMFRVYQLAGEIKALDFFPCTSARYYIYTGSNSQCNVDRCSFAYCSYQ